MQLKKYARILRSIFGWLMIVEGGISGVSVGICTLLTLFGVLETDSFGERLTSFIAGTAATVGFFIIFWLGIRLKNSGSRNMASALVMQKSSSADKKETQQAAYAAPYRTIELNFSGHQREGFSLTVEVEKWPSLERCCLRWYEWNETGGSDVKVDLPANYMTEHTVEEFLAEYILKENDVTKRIPFPMNEGLLRQIRDRLTECGVLQAKRTADAGKITVQDARNAVPSDNVAMISEKKFEPIFISSLEGYQMKMHTDSGEAYCFTLTGLKAYDPNMGSRCGYGSDDWCFHCKYNGENYILHFSVDAGSGTYWDCALINKENAEQLEKLSAVEWLKLVLKSETQIFHLHPNTIDAAKDIVQDTSSRCGPISDNGFYGR